MSNLSFKCRVCKSDFSLDKKTQDHFADWAYGNAQWSDFGEDVPDLSEEHWERSSITPSPGEKRTVFIEVPFDESLGSDFWLLFEPALIYFNGPDDAPDDIDKCAVARCRFDKVLAADAFSAWIRITVLNVIPLSEIYKYYDEAASDDPINELDEFSDYEIYTFQNDRWLIKLGSAQGDYYRVIWIYKDDNNTQDLVMQDQGYMHYSGDINIGNIVNYPHT